ncbi:hypothetical protein SAMN02745216_03862 [Desulfatibacillum alkenivorans DSM 16219]|jgi:hypothetical protein|uniref:SurA N-terminal domain-containing protein n=1 Tax=Desulfatibacillum alkenivorans DSM 16219 TaxID=1121393 RepID=A0A1M6UCH9_9BACT|nr:hypothetical protein [Desulfatibacillum alkenivorans]SHK66873.1 hypothetical protein SAMN02745216_03862 [Desulfatibacillum alkenivorans DSM 16219]
MKKVLLCLIIAAVCIYAVSCTSEEQPDQGPVVLRVNDYCLCQKEFRDLLAQEMRLDEHYKLTLDAQKQFLEDLVARQVLIQEAKRLELDSRPDFVLSVQRFWESTLIRDLMDMKAREIEANTLVTQEEVLDLYRKQKQSDPYLPAFEDMREELFDRVMEEKKTRLLSEWIKGLEAGSRVEISEKSLFGQSGA